MIELYSEWEDSFECVTLRFYFTVSELRYVWAEQDGSLLPSQTGGGRDGFPGDSTVQLSAEGSLCGECPRKKKALKHRTTYKTIIDS